MPQDQSVVTGGRKLDAEEINLLMERGRRLLADGDLPSARLVFQRAAEAGDATAALALGATYDANILGRLGLVGLSADVDKSRAWYEKAAALGSPEAARRLELLAKR
jgi:TPR repeat protein